MCLISKAYHLINRFSEDIDISIDREGLGFAGEKDPAHAPSKKKQRELRDDLKESCAGFIAAEVLPRFQKACVDLLGKEGWSASMDARDVDKQSILFKYPLSLTDYATGAYLAPSVLLEFGCQRRSMASRGKDYSVFCCRFLS